MKSTKKPYWNKEDTADETSITGFALQSNYNPVLSLPLHNASILPMIQKLFSPNPIL